MTNNKTPDLERARYTRLMSRAPEMYELLKQLVTKDRADVRERAAHVLHEIDSGQRSSGAYGKPNGKTTNGERTPK